MTSSGPRSGRVQRSSRRPSQRGTPAESSDIPTAHLSIGALSRATGVPVPTLRTWERRYGFPRPERKASGHRVYPMSSVERLRRMAAALALGHRAAEVLTATDDELLALCRLGSSKAGPPLAAPATDLSVDRDPTVALAAMLACVEGLQSDRLMRMLLADWARGTPLQFLTQRVVPLITAVGDGWANGALDVRHEHFVTEKLSDLLRMLRLPMEERARGPLVVLATLPDERHGLGLQMAALVLSAAGCRVLSLGTETPVEDVAQICRELDARAVGISVSRAGQTPSMVATLGVLRRELPPEVALLVGGEGAPPVAGVEVVADLAALEAWGRSQVGA